MVLQAGGILVLPPQTARVDEEAIVGALVGDHRQRVLVVALAGDDFLAPSVV